MSPDVPAPPADEKARYEAIKQELKSVLAKKRDIDKHLAHIEVKVYNLETTYLNDTSAQTGGNIIHGFEGYLKNIASSRKKAEIKDETDRIFSNSSVSHKKSLELSGEGEDSAATGEDHSRTSTPALTTVIVPPARSQELTAAQNKKNRDREYQRKKRANARRSSVALSDDESVTSASSRRPTKRSRMDDD
ncbi:unnamed protein product [Somion occarium]|uniref:Chromatin modification-related protein EAF6 n=1 Tax=Somion occarium TaxID=3059160 RepID=A0ABP1E1Z6_9APHY